MPPHSGRDDRLLRDVPDNAQEVASIDALGEGASPELPLEGADSAQDMFEGISGDGGADVALGVEQAETRQGAVEEVADHRVLARLEGLAGFVLLLEALLEGGAGLVDLLGRRRR